MPKPPGHSVVSMPAPPHFPAPLNFESTVVDTSRYYYGSADPSFDPRRRLTQKKMKERGAATR